MDADQLWETTMDPEHRTLIQVRIEDAMEADETFSLLMGEKVEPRRAFIQQNAKYVTNLDVWAAEFIKEFETIAANPWQVCKSIV